MQETFDSWVDRYLVGITYLENSASRSMKEGNYTEAVNTYNKILRLEPRREKTLVLLGKAYFMLNQDEEAVNAYNQAIPINPQRRKGQTANIYFHLACALERMGRGQDALTAFQTALTLNPGHIYAFKRLGLCFQKLELYEEALPFYNLENEIKASRAAINHLDILNPPERALVEVIYDKEYNKAFIYTKLKRHKEALEYLEIVLKKNPKNGFALKDKGNFYEYGYIVEINFVTAAEYYIKAGENNCPNVQEDLNRLFNNPDISSGDSNSIGVAYYNSSLQTKHNESFRWFEKSSKKDPTNGKAFRNLALYYEYGLGVEKNFIRACDYYVRAMEEGYFETKKDLERLIAKPEVGLEHYEAFRKRIGDACYKCGLKLYNWKKYAEALTAFDGSLSYGCKEPARFYRGLTLNALARSEEAVESIENSLKAVELEPNNQTIKEQIAESYLSYGLYLYQSKKYDQAIDTFNKAIAYNEKLAAAYYNRGLARYQSAQSKEQLEQVRSDYNLAVHINPELFIAPNNYVDRADVESKLLNHKDAVDLLKKALENLPTQDDLYYKIQDRIGDLQIALKNYEKAIDAYNFVLKIATFRSNHYGKKVLENYSHRHENSESSKILTHVKERKAYHMLCDSTKVKLAKAYYYQGFDVEKFNDFQSQFAYQKAIHFDNKLAVAHFRLGMVRFKLAKNEKDLVAVLELFEKAIQCKLKEDKENNVYFYRGRVFHRLMRNIEALLSYNQALAIDPNNVVIHKSRMDFINQDQLQEELQICEIILKDAPNNICELIRRAVIHDKLGNIAEAIKSYHVALKYDAENIGVLINLGDCHEKLNENHEALKFYNNALNNSEQDSDKLNQLIKLEAYIHCQAGVVLQRMGRDQEALVAFDRAIEIDSHYADAHHKKMELLYFLNRLSIAMQAFTTFVLIEPENKNSVAIFNKIIDSLKEFREHLNLLPDDSPIESVQIKSGELTEKFHNYKEAKLSYLRATRINPKSADAYTKLANICVKLQQDKDALKAYNTAIKNKSTDPQIFKNKAAIFFRLGNYTQSIKLYQQLIVTDPSDASNHNNLGLVYFSQQNYNEALKSYTRAIEIDPHNPDFYNNIGLVHYQLGNHKTALDFYNQTTGIIRYNADFHNNRGLVLLEFKEYDEAQKAFDKAIKLNPKLASAHRNHGVILYQKNQYKDALTAFDQAVNCGLEDDDIHNWRGKVFEKLNDTQAALEAFAKAKNEANILKMQGIKFYNSGKYKDAQIAFEKSQKRNSSDADIYFYHGRALYNLRKYPAALAAYETAAKLNTDLQDIQSHIGAVYFNLKKYKEASAAFAKAIISNPKNPNFHSNHGSALIQLKNYAAAETAYEEAVKLKADDANAHQALGFLRVKLKKFKAAQQAYQQAIHLGLKDANIFYDYGLILIELGEYQLAVDALKKATKGKENFIDAHYSCALTLDKLGQHEQAIKVYDEILRINPKHAGAIYNRKISTREMLNTPLHRAAAGDIEHITRINQSGNGWRRYQNRKDVNGNTPIELAALHGNLEFIILLFPGSKNLKNVLPFLIEKSCDNSEIIDQVIFYLKNEDEYVVNKLFEACGTLSLVELIINRNNEAFIDICVEKFLELEPDKGAFLKLIEIVIQSKTLEFDQGCDLLRKLFTTYVSLGHSIASLNLQKYNLNQKSLADQDKASYSEFLEGLIAKNKTDKNTQTHKSEELADQVITHLLLLPKYNYLTKKKHADHYKKIMVETLKDNPILKSLPDLNQHSKSKTILVANLIRPFKKDSISKPIVTNFFYNRAIQNNLIKGVKIWKDELEKPPTQSLSAPDREVQNIKEFINTFCREFMMVHLQFVLLATNKVDYVPDSSDKALGATTAAAGLIPKFSISFIEIDPERIAQAGSEIYKYFRGIYRKQNAEIMRKLFENIPLPEVMNSIYTTAVVIAYSLRDHITAINNADKIEVEDDMDTPVNSWARFIVHNIIDYIIETESHIKQTISIRETPAASNQLILSSEPKAESALSQWMPTSITTLLNYFESGINWITTKCKDAIDSVSEFVQKTKEKTYALVGKTAERSYPPEMEQYLSLVDISLLALLRLQSTLNPQGSIFIRTINNQRWQLKSIIQNSGFITPNGRRYKYEKNSGHNLYGFISITEEQLKIQSKKYGLIELNTAESTTYDSSQKQLPGIFETDPIPPCSVVTTLQASPSSHEMTLTQTLPQAPINRNEIQPPSMISNHDIAMSNKKDDQKRTKFEIKTSEGDIATIRELFPFSREKDQFWIFFLKDSVKNSDTMVGNFINDPKNIDIIRELGYLAPIKAAIHHGRIQLLTLFVPMLFEKEADKTKLQLPIHYILEADGLSYEESEQLFYRLHELGIDFSGAGKIAEELFKKNKISSNRTKDLQDCCEALENTALFSQHIIQRNVKQFTDNLISQLDFSTKPEIKKDTLRENIGKIAANLLLQDYRCHHLLNKFNGQNFQNECEKLMELLSTSLNQRVCFTQNPVKEIDIHAAITIAIKCWKDPSIIQQQAEIDHYLKTAIIVRNIDPNDRDMGFANAFYSEFFTIYTQSYLFASNKICYFPNTTKKALEAGKNVAETLSNTKVEVFNTAIPVSAIASATVTAANYFIDLWEKDKAAKVVAVFDGLDAIKQSQILMAAAVSLAKRFYYQLKVFDAASTQRFARCIAHCIINYIITHKEQPRESKLEKIARKSVNLVLNEKTPAPAKKDKSFLEICEAAITDQNNKTSYKEEKNMLGHRDGLNLPTPRWDFSSILLNTGVIDENGVCYVHSNCAIENYGYLLGSKAEVERRGLKELNLEKKPTWQLPDWQIQLIPPQHVDISTPKILQVQSFSPSTEFKKPSISSPSILEKLKPASMPNGNVSFKKITWLPKKLIENTAPLLITMPENNKTQQPAQLPSAKNETSASVPTAETPKPTAPTTSKSSSTYKEILKPADTSKDKSANPASIPIKPIRSKPNPKMNLITLKTEGDGDCAIHATLGEWSERERKVISTEAKKCREQLAQAIEECKPGTNIQSQKEISDLVVRSIQTLITDATAPASEPNPHSIDLINIGPKALALCEAYKIARSSDPQWKTFENTLKNFPGVIQYVATNHKKEINASFRDQFHDVLAHKRHDLCKTIMQASTDLYKTFKAYDDKTQESFNWNIEVTTPVLAEYANFIRTGRRFLLPSEVALIAILNGITVEYYAHPRAVNSEIFNGGKSKVVRVQFNGSNHYEQMREKPTKIVDSKSTINLKTNLFAPGSTSPALISPSTTGPKSC